MSSMLAEYAKLSLLGALAGLLGTEARSGPEWDGLLGEFASWGVGVVTALGVFSFAALLGVVELPTKTIPQRFQEWRHARQQRPRHPNS